MENTAKTLARGRDSEENAALRRCSIPVELLYNYHDARTDAAETARIREHLASGCAECEQELRWMQHTAQTMKAAGNVVVPQHLLEQSRALFRERFPAPQRAAWFPSLVFDSRQRLAMAGARGAGTASFQLVYRTEAFDIELWQDPLENGEWYVIGQILPQRDAAEIVPTSVVLTSETGSGITVTPESSEFHLTAVLVGTYRLTLGLPDGDIEISELQIGQ